jgi:hypothetical protein
LQELAELEARSRSSREELERRRIESELEARWAGRIGFVSGFALGVGFLFAMTWGLPWTVSRTLMVAGSGLLMGLLIGLAVWLMERSRT